MLLSGGSFADFTAEFSPLSVSMYWNILAAVVAVGNESVDSRYEECGIMGVPQWVLGWIVFALFAVLVIYLHLRKRRSGSRKYRDDHDRG